MEKIVKSALELKSMALPRIRRALGCGDVTAVEIEPLPRSGGGRNWKLGAIQPPLPELARREAEAAGAPLYGQYDLIEDC